MVFWGHIILHADLFVGSVTVLLYESCTDYSMYIYLRREHATPPRPRHGKSRETPTFCQRRVTGERDTVKRMIMFS